MLIVVSGMRFESEIAEGDGIQTICGLDPLKLVRDMDKAVRKGAKGFLSFGTAAGLAPELPAGTIVIARQLLWQKQVFSAHIEWGAQLKCQLPEALLADIAGIGHAITSVQEKASLHLATCAVAADMESHHVALAAQRHNLPWAAIRAVLDNAECSLPPAALAATKPDGSINYKGLVQSLVAQPLQLPALLRLARAEKKAKQSLLRVSGLLKGNLFGLMDLR